MKILFLGDVVAKSGRQAVSLRLKALQQSCGADFTIVNGENAAHGKGITTRIYRAFKDDGVDVVTLGNHAFSKHEILDHLNECTDLVRPVNLEPAAGGQGWLVRSVKGVRVAVVNLLGQVYMDVATEDPVVTMRRLMPELQRCADVIFIDLHAEATGEKELFFHLFADQVTAVIGTHTHVQTADEQIFHGCAYITDAGMCGSFDSVLGRDTDELIRRKNGEAAKFTPSQEPAMICGVLIDVDDATQRAVKITRIQERPA